MEGIGKSFPGVRALDQVEFDLKAGEVLALLGENGAGKSTLMKILSGVWPYPSYDGSFFIKDTLCKFSNPKEAQRAGVSIIHQELNLLPQLTVAENIFLDREAMTSLGLIDWQKTNSMAASLLHNLGINDIQPEDTIASLTIGKQQMVEIAKALSFESKILVLDEPTSALSDKEVEDLFRILSGLKASGVGMVYISHKMDEIQRIADRVAVLRDGRSIGKPEPVSQLPTEEIIRRMVGREMTEIFPKKTPQVSRGAVPVLEVQHFEVNHPFLPGEKKVKDIHFSLFSGDILGIAGLMGAGRSELVTALFGAFPKQTRGKVLIRGQEVSFRSPQDAIEAGLALLTEDRKVLGLILGQSVLHNFSLASLESFSNALGVMDEFEEHKKASDFVRELSIRLPDLTSPIEHLSGGNQQKVVLAKWLNCNPSILILDEPTRGVDVGAKAEIYRLMRGLADKGVAILMISSELPEILGMSDRVLILREGELAAELPIEGLTQDKIMAYATGVSHAAMA